MQKYDNSYISIFDWCVIPPAYVSLRSHTANVVYLQHGGVYYYTQNDVGVALVRQCDNYCL